MAEGNVPNPNVVNNFDSGTYDDDTLETAIKKAFDAITITGKPVMGEFSRQGRWMYIAYKYPNGLYGMMLSIFYSGNTAPYILNVSNGVYSYRRIGIEA